MTETPARSQAFIRYFPVGWSTAFFLFVALLSSGCSIRKKPSIPWATAVQVKPALQTHPAAASDVSEEVAPDLQMQWPPLAAILIPVRGGPARPRVNGAPPANTGSEPEKTEMPTIAPQLSRQESTAAQQETNQSLSIAEKNLAGTRGKSLNPTQSDLVSKIQGFLKDAREAAQAGDWSRARSLAKKAQVLSEELAGSL
jgi:hypothetical protein